MSKAFGIELEFTAAILHARSEKYGDFHPYLRQLLRESGIQDWRIEHDNSCGHEIVSPILTPQKRGLEQVMQVCECAALAQKQFGLARLIGPDTGVHFHYDATDLVSVRKGRPMNTTPIRNVLLLAAFLEPLWYSMNPNIRFDTAFAAPLNFNLFQISRARDITDIRSEWFVPNMGVRGHPDSYRVANTTYLPGFINADMEKPEKYDWTRYHGFNLIALFKHKTFEFRYTHGSFDPHNIEMWYNHYRKMVEVAREWDTKQILKAISVMGYSMSMIKKLSITTLQNAIYSDLGSAVQLYFMLVPHDVKELHFVLKKLVKYNAVNIPAKVAKRIWEYQGDNFDELMGFIQGTKLRSAHSINSRTRFLNLADARILGRGHEPPVERYPDEEEVRETNRYR